MRQMSLKLDSLNVGTVYLYMYLYRIITNITKL